MRFHCPLSMVAKYQSRYILERFHNPGFLFRTFYNKLIGEAVSNVSNMPCRIWCSIWWKKRVIVHEDRAFGPSVQTSRPAAPGQGGAVLQTRSYRKTPMTTALSPTPQSTDEGNQQNDNAKPSAVGLGISDS